MSGSPRSATPPAPRRREVLQGLTVELEAAGVERPRQEAERLLAHALGVRRDELLLHPDETLDPRQAGAVASAAGQRLAGVPLQHIEGTVAFRDLVLLCDRRALIPRPETEQLIDEIVAWVREKTPEPAEVVRIRRPLGSEAPIRESALDIGTGSGAIALSLVREGVVRRAVGVDASATALEQARENRTRAGLEAVVELRLSGCSPWDAVGPDERFDIIASNPPYVRDDDLPSLAVQVRDHEPRVALAGGMDGLDVMRTIIAEGRSHLRDGGALFLEIGADQGKAVSTLLQDDGPWRRVVVLPDLAGRDRFVVAMA